MNENEYMKDIRKIAQTYSGPLDASELIERAGRARFALLGEASHGTSEFYTHRAALSKRLIEEKGYTFIAVEGDWPSCYALNRYIKGHAGTHAREALNDFARWPTWMWANQEIAEFAEWLRSSNAGKPEEEKVGFYGIDLYSLWESLNELLRYFESRGGEELEAAKRAFECFEPHGGDEQSYGVASSLYGEGCEEEVIDLLRRLQDKWKVTPMQDREHALSAELNALAIHNAENYYRTMIRYDAESWNVRDRHMVQVLEKLMAFHGESARTIVWEHNTHIGDARATDMRDEGMVNVGQLLRENYGDDVYAVGFGTYEGTVIAGTSWGAPAQEMTVPRAMRGSWEELLHRLGPEDKLLLFPANDPALDEAIRGHRAIGVVYHPESERGNYVPTCLSKRYDAFIYIDRTKALSPLVIESVRA
ncbi:erythromycin esterase family protein [Paenibacillus sacheonensis]|uniref:Erythromycin esterase family protein n=1 Tax=Paenibacillus sacheonensis TaxID=742054 RepID=A0A7X4YW86_9BACL|nr:erythromycin esterase family protein [Paenibacillus sacheonensis]MBM7569112.1 erythromycin esterase-like protein [Paenibacillus sacheonensis]NBC72714.1 erythromycin esterase family protein [Paenibacillus sacheonensis]